MRKRAFDVVVISLAAVVWLPVVVAAALAVLVLSGRPILYNSRRWVGTDRVINMLKLRVMVPDAHRVMAPTDRGGRFLSTPPSSPLYTPIGRVLDRLGINEIPQFVHVLRGEMSIVGARPLTEAVRNCLGEQHPSFDQRWDASPAGLTGLPQLVGRMSLTDQQRLDLETAYTHSVRDDYSITRDFKILLFTVMITFGVKKPLSFDNAMELTRHRAPRATEIRVSRLAARASRVEPDADAVA